MLIDSEYSFALKNAIKSFDKDLACLIVLSGLSKDAFTIRRTFSLVSHVQNIRAVKEEIFTPADLAIIEATNKQLMLIYIDQKDLSC
jgi:hypothetical protein